MNDILDEVAPVKKLRTRDKDVPYVTSQWKSAISAKRKATIKYLKNKTKENWELKRKARNEATRERRIAIKEYWRKKSEDLKMRPKEFFNTFRPFLNKKDHTHNTAEIHLNDNGSIVRNQCEVAEKLADYFSTIAEGIGGKSTELRSMEVFEYHPCVQKIMAETTNLTQGIEVKPVTQIQVKDSLESLNINKATIGAKELARPLMTLFNSCINNRAWPSEWKCGEWAPLFKKNDRHSKENYRPITVLPCVSKVFEQLVGKQITAGCDKHLCVNSAAYRKKYSCETTLINLVEAWGEARDKHLFVSIMSTDMSKAFDSLHPPLLLSKRKAYGLQDNVVELLKSYLSNRKNRVKMGSNISSNRFVNRGCP